MGDNIQNGWGVHALDVRQAQDVSSSGVVSGCEVTDGSSSMEVDVSSGYVVVDGVTYAVSQTTKTLSSADPADPRKDIVYVDSSGVVQVATGTPDPANPVGETGRSTYDPDPPDLSSVQATPLAEIWVPGGASDITSADISDRSVSVSGETVSDLARRKRAYETGPTITLPTTVCASASKTGSDAEYVEESLPLRDGWRLEVFEVGAGDEDQTETSEAQIWVSGTPNDGTTYTEVYSTLDTDKVPEDGNGDIDFTTTLHNIDNTSGGVQRVFFRAVNNSSNTTEYAVWGNFTVIRRPIP